MILRGPREMTAKGRYFASYYYVYYSMLYINQYVSSSLLCMSQYVSQVLLI